MTNWPEMFFARHGETAWNRERRYQGARDIPLNEKGKKQANAIGPLLQNLLDDRDFDPLEISWYASPLSRAKETMERMRAAFDVQLPPVVFDDRLKEISFGVLEGKLHRELPAEMALAPGQREGDYWYHRPPEGESYEDVAERLNLFSRDLHGPVVIVAHGGILRALRHLAEGVSHKEAVNWPPPQGAIAHFTDGKMKMHFARM